MENLNRIKGALANAGKTGVRLAGKLRRDPVKVSKWCTNTTQPDFADVSKDFGNAKVNIRRKLVVSE